MTGDVESFPQCPCLGFLPIFLTIYIIHKYERGLISQKMSGHHWRPTPPCDGRMHSKQPATGENFPKGIFAQK